MVNARMRRLMADYQKIQDEFAGHRYIRVIPQGGNPPERYLVTYHLKGLRWDTRLNRPVEADLHEAEIYLHANYPREKPLCTMRTPIFHPNFGQYICIGDHWAAGETLADVIIQIGDMIQYRSYNPKSPLNGHAAQWARQNESRFPVGTVDLYLPEPEIILGNGFEEKDDVQISFSPSNRLDDFGIKLDH